MPEIVRDISGWVYNGMWSYCPEYDVTDISELPQPVFLPPDFPVYLQKFIMSGQSGTYIETKAHVDKAAEPVTSLPLSNFYRPVVVLDIGKKQANEPVTVQDLESTQIEIRPGDAALISTGWDARWDDPGYVEESPFISREAAFWLFDKGIGMLGADFPRFDFPKAMQFPWAEFWERVNLLLGPVVNLQGLSGRCGRLVCFPLKVKGACCTPCRAAILVDSE